jgi:zinc protease
MLKHPSFPDRELAELTRQRLNSLDEQRDEPGSVAGRLLGRHFNVHPPEHPSYTPDWDEAEARIRDVTRDQLIDFHRSHYGFGPAATISFVGDFDPDELRERLEALFGDWSPEVSFERIAENHVDIEPARLETQLDDKASAVFIARKSFPMNDEHPDYPAIRLAGHLVGGGFLSSRLANRIRDDEGLSYAIGGGFNAHSIDERGTFQAFAMYAPENRDRLVEVMFEELEKIIDEGFEADEFDAGRRGWLQQMEIRRSNDGNLVGTLSSNLYLDRDMHHEADFEERVRALSVEDVNEAVRRHFDPSRISYATAGDFEQDK